MINVVKQLIKFLVTIFGKHRWPCNGSALIILAYHRVLPKSDPRYDFEQPMMVVTPETLDTNLHWVAEHFNFISLNQWLTLCNRGRAPKGKYCAITFDDGWIDNIEYALPILKKHDAPATIFCVASMINNKPNYWPGRVTALLNKVLSMPHAESIFENSAFVWLKKSCINSPNINWLKLSTQDHSNIIENLKIYKDMEINSFIDNTKSELGLGYEDERQVLSKDELKSMLATGMIEIGSHTVNHIRFDAETDATILNYEIIESKKQLAQILDVEVNTFCYPNGYHSDRSANIAKQNYTGACTLERGWNRPSTDFSKLRRISFHEQVANNYNHFKSRLSGWI